MVEDDENDAVLVQRALDASRRPFTPERVTRLSAALELPFVPVLVLTRLDDEEVGRGAENCGWGGAR